MKVFTKWNDFAFVVLQFASKFTVLLQNVQNNYNKDTIHVRLFPTTPVHNGT